MTQYLQMRFRLSYWNQLGTATLQCVKGCRLKHGALIAKVRLGKEPSRAIILKHSSIGFEPVGLSAILFEQLH